jgi:hypothetical protein
MLSYPSKLLFQVIENFPDCYDVFFSFVKTREKENIRLLAGNFQRIFDNLLRQSNSSNSECRFITRLQKEFRATVEFCAENVDVLACQCLLTHLLTDFRSKIASSDPSPAGIIDIILDEAVEQVSRIYCMFREAKSPAVFAEVREDQYPYCAGKFVDGTHRPQCIRVPDWLKIRDPVCIGRDVNYSKELEEAKRLFFPLKEGREMNLEMCQEKAYLLLNSIFMMTLEEVTVLRDLQDVGRIEKLLKCGIGSDPFSMVSVQAFGLLESVIEGFDDRRVIERIDEYAKYMTFQLPPNLTPKMMAAFPIFWNHRYQLLDDGHTYPDTTIHLSFVKGKKDGKDLIGSEDVVIARKKGLTPLELYGRLLLDEPTYNDGFCWKIYKVLENYVKSYADLRAITKGEDNTLENNLRLLEKELVLYEFLRTEFEYHAGAPFGETKEQTPMYRNLSVAAELVPLTMTSDFWVKHKEIIGRSTVNWWVRRLCVLLTSQEEPFNLCFLKGDGFDFIDRHWNIPNIDRAITRDFLFDQDQLESLKTSGDLNVKDQSRNPSFWAMLTHDPQTPRGLGLAVIAPSGLTDSSKQSPDPQQALKVTLDKMARCSPPPSYIVDDAREGEADV